MTPFASAPGEGHATATDEALIHSLPQLTHHQRQQLASALQALLDRNQATAVVEACTSDCRACPHCSSSLLAKNGSANGLQRFKCCQCSRTL